MRLQIVLGLRDAWHKEMTSQPILRACSTLTDEPGQYISVTNSILRVPTTVLYARSVVKYVVRTTFRRAGRRQAFSPRSGYFRIPLRNIVPFDSVCFPFLFNMLNSGFIPFRYFSIRLYLQYHVPL